MKQKCLLMLIFGLTFSLKAQSEDPYQYFPANVGDRWEYTHAGPDIIYTVIRDSIDQKDSSRFIFYNPSSNYGASYRVDKHYNVFMDPQLGSWWHLYKLDAKVGESWVAVAKRWAEKVIDISQAYVFGKLTTVKTIGFYRLTNGDTVLTENSQMYFWQKLAYGFGMISEENGAEQPTLLRGCRINGVVYGTVDVKENLNELPSDFKLYQNYPNPFNPTTTITFSLPKYSHVIIKVFDVLGREIKILADDYFEAGGHKIEFSAGNLSSGIYFYQLITNNSRRTMKMILQK
ncbi:MAG: hypothetical protein FD122_1684 [Stygiobacter sp.]|nr:MAG: hypothetical protein FD122_1684 [Stygiobacter sp.]KAF0216640.1 MAG: hypothetical protein FD178_1104 [Ignavibacteria bacterium]